MNRIPPQNLLSEQSILGAILLDNTVLGELRLKPGDFYRASHRQIYQAMQELKARGVPIDIITLSEQLQVKKQLDDVGGTAHLAEINDCVPTAAGVKAHAEIVRQKALYRKGIQIATELADDYYAEKESPDKLIALYGKTEDILDDLVPFEDYHKRSEGATVFTGIESLDKKTAGICGLTLWSGHTAQNKSTAGLQIGLNWAERGFPVNLWDGENGWAKTKERIGGSAPPSFYYTCDKSMMTFGALKKQVVGRATDNRPLLHVIDDIQQLIQDFDNRRGDIDEWISWLVHLKVNYPVVFLVVSKLSREGKNKESGELEYNSDMAFRIGPEKPPFIRPGGEKDRKRVLTMTKWRMGPLLGKICDLVIPDPWRWRLQEEAKK